MTIQSNIDRIEKLKAELKAHCMCWDLREDADSFVCKWPYPVGGLHGVRVRKYIGAANAYQIMLDRCEQAWQQENSWWLKHA